MPEQAESQKSPEQLDLARRIAAWREAASLRKIDLARALNVEPSMVSKWERAQMQPGLRNLHAIAKACGIAMQEFWGDLPEAKEVEQCDANG